MLMFFSCNTEQQKLADMEEYTGPAFESTGVQILMSDSTLLKIKLMGDRQIQYQKF